MRKKEIILEALPEVRTPESSRDRIRLEVLIDTRDVLQEILITLRASAGREAFRIGQASLQEISR